jgi:hypothetical protein
MRFIRVVLFACLAALVVVPAAFALRFTDESYTPPAGETGKAYSWSFTGAGGCGPGLPYQFRTLDGSPPPGLTLDKSGLVHGVPTQAGDYSFWLELSDENPPSADWCRPSTAQRYFTMHVLQGLNIVQRQSALGGAFVNEPYNLQLTTNSAGAILNWSVVSGALPTGVSLNSSTGLISGSPTATGDFTFKVQVKDAGGTRSDSQTYNLSVVPKLQLVAGKGVAEVGIPFQLAPQATGGKPGYKWSLTGALPAGLTMDPATGGVSGTPTSAGTMTVKFVVTDTLGLTSTVDVPFTVAGHLLLTKKLLPAAKVGKAYLATFAATGGVTPRSWVLLGGRPGLLPKGLKLNARTGKLTGKPKQAGTFRLRIQVTDKLGAHSALGFVLKVTA